MNQRSQTIHSEQIAAFRLQRHHLNKPHKKGKPTSGALAEVTGDVCGIQAQVLSAAELALSARVRGITRADVASRALEGSDTGEGVLHEADLTSAAEQRIRLICHGGSP